MAVADAKMDLTSQPMVFILLRTSTSYTKII